MQDGLYIKVNFLFLCHISQQIDILLIVYLQWKVCIKISIRDLPPA